MSGLKLFLLGPPRVELDDSVVDIRRRKTLALLVYLAVANEDQRRDTLATLLWPDASQSLARASLSRDLSGLNKRLGGSWLTADRETVAFRDEAPLWVDCMQFQQQLAACQSHQHPPDQICSACLESLTEAVTVYRADFLSGFTLSDCPAFDEWQSFQTESLRHELAIALERLSQAHQAQGDPAAALPYARRWLLLDPLHEPAQRHLMQLYSQAGQRAAALRQYQECVRVLEAELGVSPTAETTALYERIRTGEEKQAESISLAPRHNLPAQPTPFVGRAEELARIARRLADPACRLLTLTGPGGIGKTRLALQAASDLIEAPSGGRQFSHGVYFVSLAPVSSTNSLVATVAEAVNFFFYGEVTPRQQILDYLREKEMLLILDNFEHLLSLPLGGIKGGASSAGARNGATELVTDILAAAPGVKIMVTSRESLNLQGEWLYPVAGLPFPPSPAGPLQERRRVREKVGTYGAVQLFEQCARRADPDFSPATAEACVVRICQLVEGMPLGIELAAAWLKMFPCEHITRELERGLDLLTTSLRNVPDRHRSMRTVFEHSWQLLSEAEQRVFRQLPVFRGGFLQDAAEQVAGASFANLVALVEKSLLRLTPAGRYEIHELLRQYAAEKLDQIPTVANAARDRHSAYYCAFLQQREADLKGARQQAAITEIEAELENARLAWHWAVTQALIERLAGAIESLGMFYEWRGRYQEGESAFRLAGEQLAPPESGDEYRLLARVLAWLGYFNQLLVRSERAGQLLEQSLSLLETPELNDQDIRAEKAFVLRVMGGMELKDSYEETGRLYEQSLALYRALGDCWGTAVTLASLCETANDFDQAKQLVDESLAIRRTLGDQRGIADSLSILGHIATERGQLEEGERLHRESLALFRESGDWPAVARRLLFLNFALTQSGKYAEARLSLEEMLQIYDNLGDRGGVAQSHHALGYAEIMLGRYRQGRTLIEAARPIFREFGWSLWLGYYFGDLGKVALAEQAYAEARQLLQEGLATFREIGDSGSIAESLDGLAYAECGLGNAPQAQQYLSEALRIAIEGGSVLPLWEALPAAALLLAERGEPERAVELYALASRYPHVANSPWFEDVAGHHIAAVAASLPPEVVAAAQERGKAWDVWETARELLKELEG